MPIEMEQYFKKIFPSLEKIVPVKIEDKKKNKLKVNDEHIYHFLNGLSKENMLNQKVLLIPKNYFLNLFQKHYKKVFGITNQVYCDNVYLSYRQRLLSLVDLLEIYFKEGPMGTFYVKYQLD